MARPAKEHRITNPGEIDPAEIAQYIQAGLRVIVQYDKSGYTPRQLEALNQLALIHGRNLEIRFYGHYSAVFDASVLRYIPEAKSVSVDCLLKASNLEALSCLIDPVELSLGIFELTDTDILTTCNLASLEVLSLGATRKCNIDLAPLSECSKLNYFHTTGHTKNISVLCGLPFLRELSLSSIRKKDDITFVSAIPALTSLRILLGGRVSIAHITSAQLRSLEIIRVQGLEEIGETGRFEALESLLIEDQARLRSLRLGPNPCLRDIRIVNCKTLDTISGVGELAMLAQLRIYKTAIDYEKFVSNSMPRTVSTFAFYTGKSRRDAEIRADIAARGFVEFTKQ